MPSTVPRDLRVDVLRCVALVSMFVAHCAPSSPVSKVTDLSEYLTAALFAFLVGVGTQLSWSRRRSLPGFFAAAVLRGSVLLALGAWIDDWGAQIYVVLAFLGVLTWVSALVVALPSLVLAVVAACLLVVAPWVQDVVTPVWQRQVAEGHGTRAWVLELLATGPAYRVVGLLLWSVLGLLGVRLFVVRDDRSRLLLPVAGVAAALAAVVFAAHELVPFALDPYDGRTQSLLFNAALVTAVAAFVLWLSPRLPRSVERVLALAGAMTLTAYVAQIGWLAYYVREVRPGQTDDSWLNMLGLTLGSIALAVAWNAVVRVQPWRRGPLEGPVDLAVRLVSRR